MGFNLNRTQTADYDLKNNHINEMINLYGVETDFIFTKKMNADKILMDFSHMQSDKNTKKILLLPEESENWGGATQWDVFGLNNMRTLSFFISSFTIKELMSSYTVSNYKEYINSLIVLPNKSFLEITDIEAEVDGVNNLYTYADEKSVYRVTAKAYNHNTQDEIEHSSTDINKSEIDDVTIPGIKMVDYSDDKIIDESSMDLDEFFDSLEDDKQTQDTEGEKVSNSDSVFGTLG